METWDHREAEPSSLFSSSWPRRGRLSEREQSQLVLDQVLNQSCKSSPFYTNSDQSYLISDCRTWLTYIRWLDNGYNSEPDWYKLSVGVSGLICVVIFVYQPRLSVSSAGRIQLLRSLQFSIFRISLVNFTEFLAFLSLWALAYCWHSSCFIVFEFLWLKLLYFQPFRSCTSFFQ